MESLNHKNLIHIMKNYIVKELDIEVSFLQADIIENKNRPQHMTDGYIPDLYYDYGNRLIVGEAKTSSDFDRQHSIEQYISYMKRCHFYKGYSIFILIVPWTEFISAKKLIRKIKEENNYNCKCLIINDFKIKEEI